MSEVIMVLFWMKFLLKRMFVMLIEFCVWFGLVIEFMNGLLLSVICVSSMLRWCLLIGILVGLYIVLLEWCRYLDI